MKPADLPAVVDRDLQVLLEKHAVVLVGGGARIVSWKKRNLYPGDDCSTLELLTEAGFRLFYRHLFTLEETPNGGKVRASLASKFLDRAPRYGGLTFAPGEAPTVDGHLNMWRGFAIEPKAGEWPLMHSHILNVLAAGDDELGTYIMDWIAWSVQNPGARAEVALVLRGGKGSGKGTLGWALVRIFGPHGVHISDRKHLVGGFNMHMAHCAMLFADEAYWPGDKQGEGALKRLITEPTLMIEPKGVDPFPVRNCLHTIVASNEDWVVPASGDERRYAIAEVSAARIGDADYFKGLHGELANGGLAAMLHDLLERDLNSWHPRDSIPQTTGLQHQKAQSRRGVDALIEVLAHEGQLPCILGTMSNVATTTGEDKREGFWHYAKATVPDLRHKHSRVIMAELREWDCTPHHSGSLRGVCFPPLPELRQKFDQKHGPQNWPKQGDWE